MDDAPTPVKPEEERITGVEGFIFACKAAVSAVVALSAFDLFHLPGSVWAPVSAVIVTQPRLHPSWKLSLTRVVANLIGAFIGALVSGLTGHTVTAMAVGVVLIGLVCHFARLEDAMRPAYAAVVIVTLSNEPQVWAGSLDRVLGVTLGCFAALVVGAGFDLVTRGWEEKEKETKTREE